MKVVNNPVMSQWRPASQRRKARPQIRQLPDACSLQGGVDRHLLDAVSELADFDISQNRRITANQHSN